MNGISALKRRGQRASLPSFYHVRTQQDVGSLRPQRGLHRPLTMLAPKSGTFSLQNWEKQVSVSKSHLVNGKWLS